ncbi:flavin-containing monooxygenase [Nocardia harenae]|uniref:flavin-containing monooxygenase n=1 Tax=Nocardia harenae TaxID=358707 RepID=UPI000A02B51A|nr:FAD-dependent oxidoreductase [Nocardia harenae]
MISRRELLDASDETIEDAVGYADPMVLRGLLYQLTGDESIRATGTAKVPFGFLSLNAVTAEEDVALLRVKAVAYLKAYRDAGAGDVPIGPAERLVDSLGLTAGEEIQAADLEMWLEELAIDPWARSLEWSREPDAERVEAFSVVVIGAGFAGLNAAVQLKRAGLRFTVLEKNTSVGGTWFANRYPGVRVDTPSRGYNHVFGAGYEQSKPFAEGAENQAYLDWVADEFEIREHVRLGTEVVSAVWNESDEHWELTADGPEGRTVYRARAVLTCVGFLVRPKLPTISGLETFEGAAFHSSQWPADLDLAGKRVAVVGTGATGFQLSAAVAGKAAHTYVVQRTPDWCYELEGYTATYPPQVLWLDRNLPYHKNFARFQASWIYGPEVILKVYTRDLAYTGDPDALSAENKLVLEQRREFMRAKFADRPDLLQAMTPAHPPLSSRPILVDSNYSLYDALLRDDVSLVTGGISDIDAHGFRGGDGKYHEVDVIVFATGFKANEFLWPMEVRGRDGKALAEVWERDGARAYIGSMVPGFPNFFMVYGPNTSPTSGLHTISTMELAGRFALECIRGLVEQGAGTVEVSDEAYWRYNEEVDRREADKTWLDHRANNYYRNEHGRSSINNPIDVRDMWKWLRSPVEPRAGVAVSEVVSPFFGQDLIVK